MNCDAASELLHAYLDAELDAASVGELEAHLGSCAACRTELAALEHVRSSVRAAPRYRAPRALREQLRAMDEFPEQVQTRAVPAWRSWPIAASLLLSVALGSGITWWRMTNVVATNFQHAFAQELLTSHLRALAATSPVDVVSEDRHTVKPWFAGRVGESPPVVDLSEQGFPLVGGRIDYAAGQRTPVVVYRHRQHVIDVYMAPPSRDRNVPATVQLQGYWVAACPMGDRSAWLVSDTDESELVRLCGLLSREAR